MQTTQAGPLPPGPERQAFLEGQPTYWLKRCYQALRRTVDAELRQYGLTLSQRDVLLALHDAGPLDQGALRGRLGLEQSTVSRLVDGLARRGLVRLEPSVLDRRVRIASITASGHDVLTRTPGSSALGGAIMVRGLSHKEQQQLVNLLRRCALNLSTSGGEDTATIHGEETH